MRTAFISRTRATACKELASEYHRYEVQTLWLAELREEFPQAFSIEEWADVVDEFETFIRDRLLMEAEDMTNAEELQLIDRAAESLGIEIDEDVWHEASQVVGRNEAERWNDDDPDPDDYRHERGSYLAEQREIHAVFTRLADEA